MPVELRLAFLIGLGRGRAIRPTSFLRSGRILLSTLLLLLLRLLLSLRLSLLLLPLRLQLGLLLGLLSL